MSDLKSALLSHTAIFFSQRKDDLLPRDSLRGAGFSVVECSLGESSNMLTQIEKASPVLLVIDGGIAERDLHNILQTRNSLTAQVVLVGGHTQQARFSSYVAAGKAMYIRRPLDIDYLTELFKDIYQDADAATRRGARKQRAVAMDQFGAIYGSSAPMRDMYRFLRKAAASESVLCIHGESGTGKELAAQAVHAYSAHSSAPFEAINCAAIPAELVESELFGHEKGSFSGAVAEHIGIFERVGRGTLLLDEITEMPQGMQVKLLRVLESGRFRRVGGEIDHNYQARVIAATNRDPLVAVRQGKLREDLFYRISQLEVRVPPLRERGQDIVELSRLFVAQFDEDNDRRLSLTPQAEKALANYAWPGNVRQLWNVIQKACTISREKIAIEDLPLEQPTSVVEKSDENTITVPINRPLHEAEQYLIEACLKRNSGDKALTASTLGISLRTLYARLEKYRQRPAR
ncbi:MAG: DNA-binding NtrC family response regulator [Alcanivorax sp.]|jgi:DNA-binding NtrC family response regulator